MGLIHCALSQHGCVTLRTAVNISAFRNPTEPLQPGPGPWLYCAVSNEPRVRMGACSKLKYLQRYITTSLFMQPPPHMADQTILSSNLPYFGQGRMKVSLREQRKVIISMGYNRFACISFAQRMWNLWMGFVIQFLAPAAVLRGCFSSAIGQFYSAFIPCTCHCSTCSDGETLPST